MLPSFAIFARQIFILLSLITWLTMASELQTVAQTNDESEEQPTRSYIGIGGDIGLSGEETAIGEGGFAVLGRNAITENISLHNSTVFGDDNATGFALTFGVPIQNSSSARELIYPFAGGGVLIEDLFGDFDVNGLVVTGIDIPLFTNFTGTVRLNIGFADDDTDVGLLLGVGYNFSIFDYF